MNTYYTLFEIDPQASQADIDVAYQRQQERYNPDRIAHVDAELLALAQQRSRELEQAYQVLSDPEQRYQYDVRIGVAEAQQPASSVPPRRTLSIREIGMLAGGVLIAVLLIALIWNLTGREASGTPAVGEVNRPAPDFSLPLAGGGEVTLSDYRGDIVLLNFWATWCEPCRREMPALQSSYAALRDQGFVIIGVNLADDEYARGSSEADIIAFTEQYGVEYPIALDIKGEVANAYRLFPLPTSYFIDAQGQIRYVRVGEISADEVAALVAKLKQERVTLRQ